MLQINGDLGKLVSEGSDEPSRPVFLHFCDREFLTLFGAYHRQRALGVLTRDVRSVLLSSFEPAYFAASLLFESSFAKHLLQHAGVLFRRGHIQLVFNAPSLYDFVLSKQDQYGHNRERYPFYFNDFWTKVLRVEPFFRHKESDTTRVIASTTISDITGGGLIDTAERLGMAGSLVELDHIIPFVLDAISSRGTRAVTRALFRPNFGRVPARKRILRVFDVKVTEHFIQSYLVDLQATLATGLSSGLGYFDYLSPTYPYHDHRIWSAVYSQTGISPFISKMPFEMIAQMREEPVFRRFVLAVRAEIKRRLTANKLEGSKGAWITGFERARQIDPVALTRPRSLDDVLRVLEFAADHLYTDDSGPSIPLFVSPMRRQGVSDNVVFVAYGRDNAARTALFALLRSAGVNPREFEQLVVDHGGQAAYVGEIVDRALKEAASIIVLFTPDEKAELKPELRERGEDPEIYEQPRPNVILEAGMALAHRPQHTIIVQIGRVRPISDLTGRHIIQLDDSIPKRMALLQRLRAAGCRVDLSGNDWMTAGNFGS